MFLFFQEVMHKSEYNQVKRKESQNDGSYGF
jgi:hypothetical protein